MEKLLALATDTLKTVLPPAIDLIKSAAGMLVGIAGKLAKLALPAAKGGEKKLMAKTNLGQKSRRLLRKTAVISGLVLILSIAGLILTREKK